MPEIIGVDLDNLRELIAKSELSSIECYEVSARRHDVATAEDAPKSEGQFSINVEQRVDENSFGIRLVGAATMEFGEASASVAGEYILLEGCRPSTRTLQMFTNEVGVMTIFPYLREAISTTTSRVFGEPLLLPTLQRGEVSVEVDKA